jgi:hypothetical protein
MAHYRDLAGRDLGVRSTPRNREIMERAIRWTEEHIHRGAVTYVWDEDGLLYFGGPWLGTWDLVDGVYVLRGRRDRRTSWAPVRPGFAEGALARMVEDILQSEEPAHV